MMDKLCTEQKTFKDDSPTIKKEIVAHAIMSPNNVRRGGGKLISLKTFEEDFWTEPLPSAHS